MILTRPAHPHGWVTGVLIPWRALNDSYPLHMGGWAKQKCLNTLTGIEWFLPTRPKSWQKSLQYRLNTLTGIEWFLRRRHKMEMIVKRQYCLNTLTGIEWFLLPCAALGRRNEERLNTLTGIEWFLRMIVDRSHKPDPTGLNTLTGIEWFLHICLWWCPNAIYWRS